MDGRRAQEMRGVGLAVAAGGGIGAVARFAVAGWVATWAHPAFPWGTFAVNLAGSVALGLFTGALARARPSLVLRGFLLTGLCGGFTTFSAFDFETLALLRGGAYAAAAAYALGSVAACIAGVLAGLRLAGGRGAPA